jgi:bifunctional non-homologous end joining protein LigD
MPYQRTKPLTLGAKAPFPGFIEPALATKIGKVPAGERWIHEIKFDGYRVQLHIANDAAKFSLAEATTGPSASRRSGLTPT